MVKKVTKKTTVTKKGKASPAKKAPAKTKATTSHKKTTAAAKKAPSKKAPVKKVAPSKKKSAAKAAPKKSPSGKNISIALPNVADITSAKALKEDFLKALSSRSGKCIVVDASAVEKMTTPAMQLLLSLSLSAEKKGWGLQVKNPSVKFEDSINVLGLSAQYEKWVG